ncbi:protease inhibitor I42 family protein [Acidisarcina polymorpha]|nr:protease inhibitor I42 family protein [Acidisarcina polymorpha]
MMDTSSSGWRRWRFAVVVVVVLTRPLFAKTVTLTSIDNRSPISLVEGDTLIVTLPSTEPGSYSWREHLTTPSPLTAVREFKVPKQTKNEGLQTFHLNAAAVGKATLAFRLEPLLR